MIHVFNPSASGFCTTCQEQREQCTGADPAPASPDGPARKRRARKDASVPPSAGDDQAAPPGSSWDFLPGGVLLDEPVTPPAIWGTGDAVLWADGESLIIAGPDGTGKTTLGGQLMRARIGIGDGTVLGHPVAPGKLCTLYLAMDRPSQAMRALRRMFTAADLDALNDRLVLRKGPPPFDLARYPAVLAQMARDADADTIIIDSLKDAALKLADDETGSGWNRARQLAIQGGAELIELHHPRKAQADNKKPSKLEDLYGSRWITAGAGSVICLWGESGDLIVEFTHLKAPAGQAGPWRMGIDPDAGTVCIAEGQVDLVQQIKLRGFHGMTAEVAARLLFGADKPTRAQIEKARYRLDKLAAGRVLYRRDGSKGGTPATWFLIERSERDDNQ